MARTGKPRKKGSPTILICATDLRSNGAHYFVDDGNLLVIFDDDDGLDFFSVCFLSTQYTGRLK